MKLTRKEKRLLKKYMKIREKLDKVHPLWYDLQPVRDYIELWIGTKQTKQATIDWWCGENKDSPINQMKRHILEKEVKEDEI